MIKKALSVAVLSFAAFGANQALAAPIYATSLVTSSNVTAFGSGIVTGAPDGSGLFLGSTFDPPAQLGSFTVKFDTALGNGAGVDLVIFEIASSANETFNVEVSSDDITFTLLGEFSATNNQIDFGAFVDPVAYVRLTNTSTLVSADIDALQGNYAASVPEPISLSLVGIGIAGLAFSRRKSKTWQFH